MRAVALALLIFASCACAATITFDSSKYRNCTLASPCFLDNPSVWIGGISPGDQDDVIVDLRDIETSPTDPVAQIVLDTNNTLTVNSFTATNYERPSSSGPQYMLELYFNAALKVKGSFTLVGDGVSVSDGSISAEDVLLQNGARVLVREDEFDASSLTVTNSSHFGSLNSTRLKIAKVKLDTSSLFLYGAAEIGVLESSGYSADILITGTSTFDKIVVVGGRLQLISGASTKSIMVEDSQVYITFQASPGEASLSNCTGQYAPGASADGALTTINGGTLRIIAPAEKATIAAYEGAVLIPAALGSKSLNVNFDIYDGSTLKFATAPVLGGNVLFRDNTGFWEVSAPGPLVTGSLILNNTVVVYQTEPNSRFSVVRCEHRIGEFSPNVEWPDSHLYGTNWTAAFHYTESNVYLAVSVNHQAPVLPVWPPEEPESPAAHHEPVAPVFQSATWIVSTVGVGLSTILIFIVVFSLKVCSKNASEDEATTWLTSDLS